MKDKTLQKESKSAEENGVTNRAGSGSWWGWTGNVDWDQLRAPLLNDLIPESPPSLPMNISAHSKTCIGREELLGAVWLIFILKIQQGPSVLR